jgi:hypothetical protein
MANREAPATARQLAHVALFQGLSEDTLVRIAGLAHAKSLAPFELSFSEGEQAEAFFVLTSESIRVCRRAHAERGCGPWHDPASFPGTA